MVHLRLPFAVVRRVDDRRQKVTGADVSARPMAQMGADTEARDGKGVLVQQNWHVHVVGDSWCTCN